MQRRRTRARSEFERQALVHLDALYGAAYRLTRNPRDAEDLVQDSLLRAYRFWDSFEQDSNCKAWLLRIVTNTFINEYQRKKRSREVLDAATAEQDATDGVLVHAAAQTQRDAAERALLERSVSDDVQRALEALPDDFRTAVVLCDIRACRTRRSPRSWRCPVGTVMSRLFRGRKLLAALAARVRGGGGLRQAARPSVPPASDDAGADRPREVPRPKAREGSR